MSEHVLDPLIEGYLSYCLTVARRHPRTVTDMRCSLSRAVNDLAVIRPDRPLWQLNLEDYVQWLEQLRTANYSANSLCKFLSHVRGLLEYAWRSGRAQRNVLDGFYLNDGTPKDEPASLSLREAQRLIVACARSNVNERSLSS